MSCALSNSKGYFSRLRLHCQEEIYIFWEEITLHRGTRYLRAPLRDVQLEPVRWRCRRCGLEQYRWDRLTESGGAALCAACAAEEQTKEDTE